MERGVTYIDTHMYVPVETVNYRILRYSLAIGDMPSEAELINNTHVKVPRKFMDASGAVVDNRPTWDELDITTKTTLRPEQKDALLSMIVNEEGILNLGCGHGKTVISINYIASVKQKTLVIVNRVNLISQWKSEILTHLNIAEDKIGVVQGKRWDYKDKYIVIASINTLCTKADCLPTDFADSFGIIIFDECHHLSAPIFRKVCPLFVGKRHGLSATPKREDGYERAFEYHIGKVHFSNISQDLVPTINFYTTSISEDDLTDECKDVKGEVHHRKLCAWLGNNLDRNKLILNIANELVKIGHKVLCLTHSFAHIKTLEELHPNCGIACGEVPAEDRKSNIENNDISFATIDVAAEALNVPSLSALIIMTPLGAKMHGNTLRQALGRIQRKHVGKQNPIAIFINDCGVFMCSALMRQCKKRLKEWGYNYNECVYEGNTKQV